MKDTKSVPKSLATVLFVGALGLSAPALSAGDPAIGQAAFATYCSGCHVASHVPGHEASSEVIGQHMFDMYEAGKMAMPRGDYLDDLVAYLATLRNHTGLWENAPAGSEAGWGLAVAHQGDMIFATWFTYDASGKGVWYAMSAAKTAPGVYAGDFYKTNGPAYNSVRWTAQVAVAPVGNGTLTFTDDGNGSFEYNVDGVAQVKPIVRSVFGPLPSCGTASAPSDLDAATNYQDLWWAAPGGSEAGWGIHLTHQGDTIFAAWFTYDFDRSPMWLVVTAKSAGPGVYSGTLYRTTGPAFHAVRFDPAAVVPTAVGNATLTFADGDHATFAYSVDGVAGAKAITREVFAAPGTVCR
jgi:hypothetical protein